MDTKLDSIWKILLSMPCSIKLVLVGIDLIADGLVLIFVAGTWYLLAMLITGKDLFHGKYRPCCTFTWIGRIVDGLVASFNVRSGTTVILKVASGEMVTAFELITQGLAFFITLATLLSAPTFKNDQSPEISFGRPFGLCFGSSGRNYASRFRFEPDFAQYPMDYWATRACCNFGRTYDDSLFSDLYSPRFWPMGLNFTVRNWRISISGPI